MIISWEKIVKIIGFVGLLEHEEDRMIFFFNTVQTIGQEQ